MEAGLSCLLLLALGAPSAGGGWSEAQIIGGHEAAPHSHPYMASLQKSGSHLCGAALVHPRWVLTAAHCLGSRTDRLRLVLGLHQLDGPGLPFRIKAVVTHPYYKPAPDLENDLALLQLDGKVKSTRTIRALALPRGRRAVATGVRCSMAGWGLTQRGGRLARALQELDLRVLDTRMCNNSRFWHGSLPPHVICLAANMDSESQAPCKGDSGGPVVCGHGGVAGILSFSSKSCTDVFKPPVATAVAPYVPWIKKVIGRWHPGVSAAPAHFLKERNSDDQRRTQPSLPAGPCRLVPASAGPLGAGRRGWGGRGTVDKTCRRGLPGSAPAGRDPHVHAAGPAPEHSATRRKTCPSSGVPRGAVSCRTVAGTRSARGAQPYRETRSTPPSCPGRQSQPALQPPEDGTQVCSQVALTPQGKAGLRVTQRGSGRPPGRGGGRVRRTLGICEAQ